MKNKEWIGRRSHHWIAKIVCLLVAVIFWLYVMRVAPPLYDDTYTDVPVSVVGAESFAYTGTAGNLSALRIKATKEDLAKYTAADVVAWVDLLDLENKSEVLYDGKTVKLTVRFKCPEGMVIDDIYEVDVSLRTKAP